MNDRLTNVVVDRSALSIEVTDLVFQKAIADSNAPFANVQVLASAEKLEKACEILENYGNYEWLTSSGSFVILNNGIEFAVTYLVMLLALIVLGSGRYISLDYWISYYLSEKH